jgi:hypothetical protein
MLKVESAVDAKHYKAKVKSKSVCPEAVAAWVDVCFDDSGKQVQKMTHPVGVI